MNNRPSTRRVEFGDFQTPLGLAIECCEIVRREFGIPDDVVEPTCGEGAFAVAAAKVLQPKQIFAYEINSGYTSTARDHLAQHRGSETFAIHVEDFFEIDWQRQRQSMGARVLFLGNPPWVTNSQLGKIDSDNLPRKSNVEGVRGIEALTGKSNFDIAESMLQTLLHAMRPGHDSLAMLVKTATARKLIRFAWKNGIEFSHASIRSFDPKPAFGVNVDTSLLMLCRAEAGSRSTQVCLRSAVLGEPATDIAMGWVNQTLVADPREATATASLESEGKTPWRSGIKHDLAGVLQLSLRDGRLETSAGEELSLEPDLVYPLAKGADVANSRTVCESRRLLVTQRFMNDRSDRLSVTHPLAFRYLDDHIERFAARKSSIYRNRDRFAIFGIGPYTFAPWKVAVCGLYKRLSFAVYGPIGDRPVVFDDTSYFLPCESEQQARFVQSLLNSDLAVRFFQARVFWDSKRPITADLLRRLDLEAVASQLGRQAECDALLAGVCDTSSHQSDDASVGCH